jgi:outer membrane protein assembly factor BamB
MRRFDRATPICGVSRTDRSTDPRPMTRRPARPIGVRYAAAIVALLALPGCSSLSTWIPTIPAPSFDWFSSSKKLGPLPEFKAAANARIAWQVAVGKASPGLAPAATPGAIYAAATNGTIIRVDPATGATAWRIEAGMRLSAGVGADASLVAVGTDKGDVLAFTTDGKPLWQVKVTSEVVSPPRVADGVVVVRSGDGRVFGLAAADGKTRWVYLRNNPPLTVRNYAGGVITRGALFVGTAGGKLLALDLATGNIGWEGNVATPKGATELERIADVTSLPFVDEQQACAVAFQGRVACFEILRGTLNWSRELSSLEGIVGDSRYIYVTDDRGAVHALDRTTGASVWKQDKLAQRRPGGPQLLGDYLTVVDGEGYGYLLDRADGSLVGRVATDGTPPTAQPVRSGGTAVWQSTGGTLVSVGAS